MRKPTSVQLIAPADVAAVDEEFLLVLARRVRSDRLLRQQIAAALAPVVSVSDDEGPRPWP